MADFFLFLSNVRTAVRYILRNICSKAKLKIQQKLLLVAQLIYSYPK